jgi:hypothetical protein
VNKLWPTDPLHLRRQLYVPLDACRWAKASEMFIRGPGEGEITILNKKFQAKKSTQNTLDVSRDDNTTINGGPSYIGKGKGRDMSPQETPVEQYDSAAVPLPQNSPLRPVPTDDQVLSIIRIPASEMSFFPKNAKKSPNQSKSRSSLETESFNNLETLRRASSTGSPSSSSRNSFSTAPRSVVSSPSSLRNSFESITRPFSGGRLKSMTPIDESGSPLGNPTTTRSSQPPIELQPRRSNDTLSTVYKKTEQRRRPSSGWNFNFFSVADDGLDPTDIGNIKI